MRFLQVDHVSSGYGKSIVVDDVTLKLESGQTVAVIGANGSGKSTLVKTIVGLIKPFSGRIRFDGTDITALEVDEISRRGVGYVPQIQNVFPNLSVTENLRIGGYYLSTDQLQSKVREMYSIFPELEGYAKSKVEKLSGGERQMVAFARSLMTAPKILLLDEPTAGLAPIAVDKVMKKIESIEESGVSVLMIEQNARKALQVCDYAYVVLSGRILKEGDGLSIQRDENLGRMLLGVR